MLSALIIRSLILAGDEECAIGAVDWLDIWVACASATGTKQCAMDRSLHQAASAHTLIFGGRTSAVMVTGWLLPAVGTVGVPCDVGSGTGGLGLGS